MVSGSRDMKPSPLQASNEIWLGDGSASEERFAERHMQQHPQTGRPKMSTLIFPIAIEPGDEAHAFGVVVPDLPGCFSAGDTLEEAYANAKEAIETHLAVLIDEGMAVPVQQALSGHRSHPDYADWLWGFVEVADIPAMKKTVRLNISLSENLLREIDQHAKSMHLTRSGFLAQAALTAMERQRYQEGR